MFIESLKKRRKKNQLSYEVIKRMNNMINKVLFFGDKFMSEMYVRVPRFTYSACRSFIKSEYKNLKTLDTLHCLPK